MLDEFRLDGEMYRFAVCIGNPHYVYREEPPQHYYEQQQEEVAAEQPADFYGDDCGVEQLPQHQLKVLKFSENVLTYSSSNFHFSSNTLLK
jgi:hypothetical protein